MSTIHCEAQVLPDGHLLLPPEIARRISTNSNTTTTRHIIILNSNGTNKSKNLNRFCGHWLDDRDADDIIDEITGDRSNNRRSETFEF